MDRVYVANLPPDIRIKDIDDFFRPFGNLSHIDVNRRSSPVYAFVQFDSSRSAFNAVKARQGYDYEGYTLQLRLVENEVRNRRDATPPPPPPSMFISYERQNIDDGFSNNCNNSRVIQNYSANFSNSQRCMDISLNMMTYSSDNRQNMDRQFSNPIRSNMQQSNSNFNRSNIQQQFSNIRRTDMEQQNMTPYSYSGYSGNSNVQQQLSNMGRSNITQLQNMNIEPPSNSYCDTRNNDGRDRNSRNIGNNFNNGNDYSGRSTTVTPMKSDKAQQNLDQKYIRGLSGSGRKWFHRYLDIGFSPEVSRAKALEHRKLPYLRGFPTISTNLALETINNKITSLSTNPVDNNRTDFTNNMEGSGIEMPGPSSLKKRRGSLKDISKRQYIAAINIVQKIAKKPNKSDKDRASLKYHTLLIRRYKKFNKPGKQSTPSETKQSIPSETKQSIPAKTPASKPKNGEYPHRVYKPTMSSREKEIAELMSKEKAKLLEKAKEYVNKKGRTPVRGACKRRANVLMDHGFLEVEAKSLAVHHLVYLEKLLSLKREYDLLARKPAILASAPKAEVYRNDLQYFAEYSKHEIKGLSKTILYGLTECIKRMHNYEMSANLPLTENKFTRVLNRTTSKEDFFKNINKRSLQSQINADPNAAKDSENPELNTDAEKGKDEEENATINEDNQVSGENIDNGENQCDEDQQDVEQVQDNADQANKEENEECLENEEENNQNESVEEQNGEE